MLLNAISALCERIHYFLYGRLFEWTFSLGTLWLAVETLIWPDSIRDGAFKRLTDLMDASTVSAYAFAVAFAGMVALSTNGLSFVWGPMVRSICAIGRAYLWAQMGYALFLLGQNQPTPSIGFGFWAIFASSELYVAYRAMADVQRTL